MDNPILKEVAKFEDMVKDTLNSDMVIQYGKVKQMLFQTILDLEDENRKLKTRLTDFYEIAN